MGAPKSRPGITTRARGTVSVIPRLGIVVPVVVTLSRLQGIRGSIAIRMMNSRRRLRATKSGPGITAIVEIGLPEGGSMACRG